MLAGAAEAIQAYSDVRLRAVWHGFAIKGAARAVLFYIGLIDLEI
jgi:hypothetical protein